MSQTAEEEPIYNVVVTVIDLVPASSEADAIAKLGNRLAWAGFDVHEDGDGTQQAFESEPLDAGAEAAARRDWKVVKRLPEANGGTKS